jgi:hypothetical protein
MHSRKRRKIFRIRIHLFSDVSRFPICQNPSAISYYMVTLPKLELNRRNSNPLKTSPEFQISKA